MNKRIIITAAIFGLTAVVLGAFGAHTLKDMITETAISTWNKGVEYQFYHTFALLYISTFARYKNNLINIAYICFTTGILLFSGSLYLLATAPVSGLNIQQFGFVTPIGGLLFILGWVMLLLAALKDK